MEHLVVGDLWVFGPTGKYFNTFLAKTIGVGDCTEWWPTNSILKCYSSYIRIKWWSPKTTTEDLKEHHPRNPKISKTTPQPRNRIFKNPPVSSTPPPKFEKSQPFTTNDVLEDYNYPFPFGGIFIIFSGAMWVQNRDLPLCILIAS